MVGVQGDRMVGVLDGFHEVFKLDVRLGPLGQQAGVLRVFSYGLPHHTSAMRQPPCSKQASRNTRRGRSGNAAPSNRSIAGCPGPPRPSSPIIPLQTEWLDPRHPSDARGTHLGVQRQRLLEVVVEVGVLGLGGGPHPEASRGPPALARPARASRAPPAAPAAADGRRGRRGGAAGGRGGVRGWGATGCVRRRAAPGRGDPR